MCVPICLFGVLLTAQPDALFGSSTSSNSISRIGAAVGFLQVMNNGHNSSDAVMASITLTSSVFSYIVVTTKTRASQSIWVVQCYTLPPITVT